MKSPIVGGCQNEAATDGPGTHRITELLRTHFPLFILQIPSQVPTRLDSVFQIHHQTWRKKNSMLLPLRPSWRCLSFHILYDQRLFYLQLSRLARSEKSLLMAILLD